MTETTLYREHPAMFRQHPFKYILCVALVLAFGLGLIILLIWRFRSRGTTLSVTTQRTILETGILSRHVNEVRNRDVCNIQIDQTPLQRLLRVGTVSISTAAQSGVEIQVDGMPDPQRVRDAIDQERVP